MDRFDLVVIGAGAAGITAAKTAVSLGARVVLAERGPCGGLCVNRGCIPKKALVTAGRVHRLVHEAVWFGTFTGPVRLDWDAVQHRQNEIVDAHRPAVADLEKHGIRMAIGAARFTDPHIVEVNGRPFGAERFIIAGGLAARHPGRSWVRAAHHFRPAPPPARLPGLAHLHRRGAGGAQAGRRLQRLRHPRDRAGA